MIILMAAGNGNGDIDLMDMPKLLCDILREGHWNTRRKDIENYVGNICIKIN